jgi:hypothetical protein
MPQPTNKSDLCEPERQLVDLLRDLDFGRIQELQIRDDKPVLDPPPRVIATLSMKAESFAPEEARLGDFALKQPVVLLLLLIRQIGEGKILIIEVRHGLPVSVEVERALVRRGVSR